MQLFEMSEEDQSQSVFDLVEQAVAFIQGRGYPAACTDNVKISIRRKAETLSVREGEVFVPGGRKSLVGKG